LLQNDCLFCTFFLLLNNKFHSLSLLHHNIYDMCG
jgi:hypothetical protein